MITEPITIEDDVLLAQRAFVTGNKYIAGVAQAMLWVLHEANPEQPSLGYFLAEHENDPQEPAVQVIFCEMVQRFNVSEFIFAHTNFDECLGGQYYRRS